MPAQHGSALAVADFTVTIPGPFPSVNHMYGYRNGRVFKRPGVESFQVLVAHLVRLAKPLGWAPKPQIRITYDFFLNRHADCDNLQKALNDAIAAALEIDDDRFLPCARSKVAGVPKAEARIVVAITNEGHEDDQSAVLGEGRAPWRG